MKFEGFIDEIELNEIELEIMLAFSGCKPVFRLRLERSL